MSGGGVKGCGISGGDPRSGEAAVYTAKALDADATTMLSPADQDHPRFFDEHSALKLVFGALTRATPMW